MILAALSLATSPAVPEEIALLYSICLQSEVVIEAQEEPSEILVVAVAFAHCDHLEPKLREWLVNGVAAQTGNVEAAERDGDLMLSALKIRLTEGLLVRARGVSAAQIRSR